MLKWASIRRGGVLAFVGLWLGCGPSSSGALGKADADAVGGELDEPSAGDGSGPRVEIADTNPRFYDDAEVRSDGETDASAVVADAQESGSDAGGSVSPLPRSFKGYELYAWEEAGELRFMLITGTNRLKTLDELTVRDSHVERADGWVAWSGSGMQPLEQLLARVPDGESVLLNSAPGLPSLSGQQRTAIEQLLARLST